MYTLSDLARISGAKRRSVQLWAEAGALKADPITNRMGPGVHRRFSRQEAQIAKLLFPLADIGLPIGKLLRVAESVRGKEWSGNFVIKNGPATLTVDLSYCVV